MPAPVILLGLGFTTQRLARRLRSQAVPVFAAVRRPERFAELAGLGVRLCGLTSDDLPKAAVLIHTVPPLPEPERTLLRELVIATAPRRMIYISSTGVYGAQTHVSAQTPVNPVDDKGRERADEEQWLARGPWSCLILRSAAIYGPGRGIHVRLREGRTPRGAGGVVSRIHVDDLAGHLDAGIDTPLAGAWPVADELPAASEEVLAWCAKLMGLPLPDGSGPGFPVAGRSVDGKAVRDLLGISLKYATYHTGIPASLREEATAS